MPSSELFYPMRTRLYGISFVTALLALAAPVVVLAHEHRTYEIGGKEYVFTVGFLNEPVAVDDSAGVELTVSLSGVVAGEGTGRHDEDSDMDHHGAAEAVAGLEKTLKVEVSAGSVKKVMDLKPAWGTPGSYHAAFHPSIQTTYSFRIFGTVNAIPINVVFSCNSDGTVSDDMTRKAISDRVVQISQEGGFGCPLSKAESTFPEVKATFSELDQRVKGVEVAQGVASSVNERAGSKAIIGIVLGAVGILLGATAWFRRPRMV